MRTRRKRRSIAKLNITSLLDMFTIMLLFLLVNFSSKEEKSKLHPDINLPVSTAELDSINAIDVVLTKDKLLLDNRVILNLRRGKFPKNSVDGDRIKPFYNALVKLKKKNKKLKRKRRRKMAKKYGKKHDVILFQSDKAIAFKMIDKVMMTTAQAGFEKFKFAVLQKTN